MRLKYVLKVYNLLLIVQNTDLKLDIITSYQLHAAVMFVIK
jgi:hypothetical protein